MEGARPANMPDLVGAASGRVEQVLKAAEQAANGILEDARAEAGRYVGEARKRIEDVSRGRIERINEITDGLVAQGDALREQAEDLRRQSDALTRTMAQATRALESEIGEVEEPDLAEAALGGLGDGNQPTRSEPESSQQSPVPHQGFFRRLFLPDLEEDRARGDRSETDSHSRGQHWADVAQRATKEGSPGVDVVATQLRAAGLSHDEIVQRLSADFDVPDAAARIERRSRDRTADSRADRDTAVS
jgi:hypothetical protein